jgi:hypothetical protein
MSLGCMFGFLWCTIIAAFCLISGFGSLVLIICLWFVYHSEDCKLYVGSFLSFFVGSIDLLAYGLKLHQHGFVFYGLKTHHMAMHLYWLAFGFFFSCLGLA